MTTEEGKDGEKDIGDYWMLVCDGEVSLTHQRVGDPPMAGVTMPQKIFNEFVKWYNTQQKAQECDATEDDSNSSAD